MFLKLATSIETTRGQLLISGRLYFWKFQSKRPVVKLVLNNLVTKGIDLLGSTC